MVNEMFEYKIYESLMADDLNGYIKNCRKDFQLLKENGMDDCEITNMYYDLLTAYNYECDIENCLTDFYTGFYRRLLKGEVTV